MEHASSEVEMVRGALGLKTEEALTSVNELRGLGLDADVDLPRICVVGKGSSGKSSVIKNLLEEASCGRSCKATAVVGAAFGIKGLIRPFKGLIKSLSEKASGFECSQIQCNHAIMQSTSGWT